VGLFSWLRRDRPLSWDEYQSYFSYLGSTYPLSLQQTLSGNQEEIRESFPGVIQGAYRSNGIIFACMLVRMLLFSEARFQFRRMQDGRPGELFGSQELTRLEHPWPGATTGDLLSRAVQDADLAGNFFAARKVDRVARMRPDWVDIVIGSERDEDIEAGDLDAEIVGYIYHPGGRHSGREQVNLLREQVCHFAPIPDPAAFYRGMSWLTPIVREVMADKAMTDHRLKFFENGATPNMVVKTELSDQNKLDMFKAKFKAEHHGTANAYDTLFLGMGMDAEVVGANLKQIEFKVVQGAGETRIAAAAGVPPVIVGLSEGLDAATYSNYAQARRRLADGTMRPLWRNMAGSAANLVNVPTGAELWYDDRDISFLQDDMKDRADIQQTQAIALKALTEAGFTPESARDAIIADDFARLMHSGMFSVQLQPPGSQNGSQNGKPEEVPADALQD
jgi:phage portal protein BeeE